MWWSLNVWSFHRCTLNIWTNLWIVHCFFALGCAFFTLVHSKYLVFWAEECCLGRTSCRKIQKLKFPTLTHEFRASWSNVCLISSPWLYIIHRIRQKASWWLIHRATGRIRESASEKELRSRFFQRGAFKALLGFSGSECSRWHQQCDGVTPFTGKTWMNRNGKNWASLLQPRSFLDCFSFFCSPCGFRFLGT